MNKRYLYLLFSIIILISFDINAQPTETEAKELLQKIDKAISDIKTVVYTIDYRKKFLSERDTVRHMAICSLYLKSKNAMKICKLLDLKLGKRYINMKYDKSNISWTNVSVDSLTTSVKPEIYSDKNTKRELNELYGHLYLKEYLLQKNPFGKYESAAGLIGITEEIHKSTPVYILTIAFKENEGVSDNVEKHYIRKSDFLPVAYHSFLRWESMEQYIYYEVDYLAINPNLSLEDFKIDKKETVNTEKRYKALKEKAKI